MSLMNMLQAGAAEYMGPITILPWQGLAVHSGGSVDCCTLRTGAYLQVFSGGQVGSIQLRDLSTATIAGELSGAEVYNSANLYAEQGAVISNVSISGGTLTVASGASVAALSWVPGRGDVIIEPGATINLPASLTGCYLCSSGAVISSAVNLSAISLLSGGSVLVYSGGTASDLQVQNYANVQVFSGGYVSDVTVSNGLVRLNFGGSGDDIDIRSNGFLHVSDYSTATSVAWTPGLGAVGVGNFGSLNFASNITGCYYISGGELIISGEPISYTTIESSLYIMNGATASALDIRSGAEIYVYGGGALVSASTAASTGVFTQDTRYSLLIESGGSVSEMTCCGTVVARSGAVLSAFTEFGYGSVMLYGGAIAENIILSNFTKLSTYVNISQCVLNDQSELTLNGSLTVSDLTINPGCSVMANGDCTVSGASVNGGTLEQRNGTLSQCVVNSGGDIRQLGGKASVVTVRPGGMYNAANPSSGGHTYNIIVSSGGLLYPGTGSGGYISGATLSSGAFLGGFDFRSSMYIDSLGSDIVVSPGILLHVSELFISSGAVLSACRVGLSASAFVLPGGSCNNASISFGAVMVSSGGEVTACTIMGWGQLHISAGGSGKGLIMQAGTAVVSSVAYLSGAAVSGGLLSCMSGAEISGVLECGGYVDVSMPTAAISPGVVSNIGLSAPATVHSGTTFMSAQLSAGAVLDVFSGGMVGNPSVLSTVNEANTLISSGEVLSASGAVLVSSGEVLSSGGAPQSTWEPLITSGSELTSSGGVLISGGNALLLIASEMHSMYGATVPVGGGVSIMSGGIVYALQETGGWVDIESGGVVIFTPGALDGLTIAGSATVHSNTRAMMVDVVAGGSLKIFSAGFANSVSVEAEGILSIEHHGVADNTMIYSGGSVVVSSGGTLVMSYAWWPINLDSSAGAVVSVLNPAGVYYGAEVVSIADTLNDWQASSGYFARVYSSGQMNNAAVSSAGVISVYDGGLLSNTSILSSGSLWVGSGGTAFDISADSNSLITVEPGGSITYI